jgi:hypothetical protein
VKIGNVGIVALAGTGNTKSDGHGELKGPETAAIGFLRREGK